MEITEVRIKLMEDSGERLQAFCSITLDNCFVIRDLKIIEGGSGSFVAMPSRKLTAHCPQCGCKNHLRAGYCNHCGLRLGDRAVRDDEGRAKLYADIAHPINSACREQIQQVVIDAYHAELTKAQQPGYVSTYDDFDHEEAVAHPHPVGKPHFLARQNGQASRPAESPRPVAVVQQIQPAQNGVRGPHRAPLASNAMSNKSACDGFGAGIL